MADSGVDIIDCLEFGLDSYARTRHMPVAGILNPLMKEAIPSLVGPAATLKLSSSGAIGPSQFLIGRQPASGKKVDGDHVLVKPYLTL